MLVQRSVTVPAARQINTPTKVKKSCYRSQPNAGHTKKFLANREQQQLNRTTDFSGQSCRARPLAALSAVKIDASVAMTAPKSKHIACAWLRGKKNTHAGRGLQPSAALSPVDIVRAACLEETRACSMCHSQRFRWYHATSEIKLPSRDRSRYYPARTALTIALALLKSILPGKRSFSAAITFPMSFTLVAPTSFTTPAIAALASDSDICLGR
jgi:hypothetical protein